MTPAYGWAPRRHHARIRSGEFRDIGKFIAEVLDGLKAANSDEGNASVEDAVRQKVVSLTDRFPIYPIWADPRHALSVLPVRRHAGEGFAAGEDGAAIRRRRVCPVCGGRFTTFERVQLRDLVVAQEIGPEGAVRPGQALRSVEIALRKRNVDPDRIDRAVTGIVRQWKARAKTEVASRRSGGW